MPGKVTLFLIFIFSIRSLSAQEVTVRGGFVQDSLSIGEEIEFWITASYPTSVEMIFPDSNFNFIPFEFLSKSYVPTTLYDQQAFDSAVYTLQSFEIEPVQYLDLPAILLTESDSTSIDTPLDSIYFKNLVLVATDTTALKTDLSYFDVDRRFNHPLWLIILGSLITIGVIFLLIFGKKIRRALLLKRMKKDYIRFSNILSSHIDSLRQAPETKLAENAITDWKLYMEKLEKKPYSKMTTKEILTYGYTRELDQTLRAIDRFVYGKMSEGELIKSFQSIEDFTQHRYSIIKDQVKHGN
ncbi:MAG: hypothetical protein KI790_06860 [Cyclobacteriaceae bacterium]|nr:hypothetical protein [Cyclobacteriaceae bacterium HetDA_MAG_MS6]